MNRLSHEILLALAYVSQISDPDSVRSKFVESLNGLEEDFIFAYADRLPPGVPECRIFPITTLHSSFGYTVMAENPGAGETECAVFRSAFKFLAVILENRIQAQVLEKKNVSLLKEISQEKSLLHTVLDTLPVGVWVADENGIIIMGNTAGEKIWAGVRYLGIDQYREYKGWWSDTGKRVESEEWAMARAVKAGESLINQEIKIECFDGTYKTILNSAAPLLDDERRIIGSVGINQDITERKQSEEELYKSESHLRTLVQTIPDLVWLKDQDGVYLSCNRIFERLFDAREDEIIGKTDFDFVDRDLAEFFRENDRKAIAAGEPVSNEEWVTFADNGHRALLETTKTPMYNDRGTLIGVLGIGRDIAERKRAEEEKVKLEAQLQQAQKMEAVGQLAGGVAHDFNNMLGVILGHAEMAMDQVDPEQPIFANLEEIRRAAERSADITRQLLAFARKQTVIPRVLDLNETVEGMLKMLRRLIGEDIHLAWLPGVSLWPVKVDPSQIDQILANLCVNARDAIKGVGKMTVETENRTLEKESCSAQGDLVSGEYVRIAVSDNGCGMEKETLSHVFEPFFTTKGVGKGTGLGLSSVYGAVKQNNGFVNVYSEPGQGTTISIYLPRYRGVTDQMRTDGALEPPVGGHETILLVEDEPTILQMTASMLERLGYTVLTTGSPGEAIRVVGELAGEIHLLLTDVIMPEMNGRDLSEKLLPGYPHLKCLFMSGYTSDVIDQHRILDEGVHFIQKPFSKRDLATKVRKALGQS